MTSIQGSLQLVAYRRVKLTHKEDLNGYLRELLQCPPPAPAVNFPFLARCTDLSSMWVMMFSTPLVCKQVSLIYIVSSPNNTFKAGLEHCCLELLVHRHNSSRNGEQSNG